ncbi:MAG: FAD-dependent monooxygenase [Bacteroidetes bacterium]|nr:FAD-dependent monooxygenase [Bacteroidota bacterium]
MTLLGAGLIGSLAAVYLTKQGYTVTIYERRPDMRKETISAGRSINLALSDRGWRGLAGAGVDTLIRDNAIPMYSRHIHNLDGSEINQAYGKENQAIYSISRRDINCLLMDAAEQNGAKIFFNHRVTNYDINNNIISIEDATNKKTFQISPGLTIGSDGAFSSSRLGIQFTDRCNYSQTYLEHGYKELVIEAGPDNSFLIEKNALHIWPRGGYMLIALPNPEGSFTCTLFFPFEGNPSFSMLKTEADVLQFFEQQFPDALKLMPNLAHDFFANPTGSLVTVRCKPWSFNNKLLLIGDAAHAIVPFYGQGMNCGFEDCFTLNEMITKHAHNWSAIIHEFEALRKPAADGIAELALMNFIEMRDLVGSAKFLLRKKIEGAFYTKYPEKWQPLYTMVTFSHLPYHEALAMGKFQDTIMDKVMELPDIENIWNTQKVEDMMLQLLAESKKANKKFARLK